MMNLIPTASQTVGPFFNFGLTTNSSLGILASEGVPGERLKLRFRVVDGDGVPTPGDAMIELWQADAAGLYPSSAGDFNGFGRLETDRNGECTFETVRPGRVPGARGQMQAPHINVIVFARGLLKHLYTRVYFDGEANNASDLVLNLVPESRRDVLLAKPVAGQANTWKMEIRLQGEDETVFFDL